MKATKLTFGTMLYTEDAIKRALLEFTQRKNFRIRKTSSAIEVELLGRFEEEDILQFVNSALLYTIEEKRR